MESVKQEFTPKRLQLLVWAFIWLMMGTCYLLENAPWPEVLARTSHDTAIYALVIYVNLLLLMPLFYDRNRYVLYALTAVLFIAGTAVLRVQVQHYFNTALFAEVPRQVSVPLTTYSYIFFSHVLIFLSSIAFKYALDYFTLRVQKDRLLRQQSLAELNLLKAQVQPHFLFNTLNNIYSVAERESPATAALLEQLSSIMRYFIEEAPKEKITLGAELSFIQSYIKLENMRLRYPVTIQVEKNVPDSVLVPPMLLIPLIENVFKHGVDKRTQGNFLHISLSENLGKVEVVVKNKAQQRTPGTRQGTGLRNLQERLKLLFDQQFEFFSGLQGNMYHAYLMIPL